MTWDGMGWDIPTSSAVSYDNWVSGRTFRVGDILEFNFVTNQHDVVRVPQASYNACSDDDAIGDTINTGPVNITLDSIGDHYYICTFGRHCIAGQRLALTTVVASSSTPAGPNPPTTTPANPSPATSACAPATPTAGGPGATMDPPPPPNSTSASLVPGGFFLMITLSTAAAFFF